MSDSDILDSIYEWARAFSPIVDLDRDYGDAVDEVLALMASRVWDSEDGPAPA